MHNPWGRLAQRWVPEPLRDARVDPGRRGALLLTLVAAVAALVAAVGVWRDRPEPQPVQSVSLARVTDAMIGSAVTQAGGGPTTELTGSFSALGPPGTTGARQPRPPAVNTSVGVIVVSVTGAVRRPGLVRLTTGSRVADAIDKAGGATSTANLTGLNLAEKLADGDSVVVSASVTGTGSSVSRADGGGAVSAPDSKPAGAKLDLNTADAAALDALPGVGPVTAASIVAWREKNGHFNTVDQLQEITGIGPAKFAALAQLVTV